MLEFIIISFIAGALTVLAPCVLPLLPVIVGGSAAGGEPDPRRAFVIVGSLCTSVFLFTLLLNAGAALIHIPDFFWQLISGFLIFFFGIAMYAPSVWDRIPAVNALYRRSNRLVGKGYFKRSLIGDALVGVALGPVFSSCNPTYLVILAAVLLSHFSSGVWYLVAYIFGMCLALSGIALLGKKAIGLLGVASDARGWFKKITGALFVMVGIAVIFGWVSN